MVVPDDPERIQGVTATEGDSGDVAPAFPDSEPESEPSPGGEPAPAGKADRDDVPDKNRYKELLRKHAKLEDRLEQMQIELAAQALASERSSSRAEPEQPPYSPAEVKALLDAGEMDRWAEAREANAEWRTEHKFREAQTQQSQAQVAQEVDRYVKELVHLDEDSDFGQAVVSKAREIRRKLPGQFAPELYMVFAMTELAREGVTSSGSNGDIRGESLSRSSRRQADTDQPSGVPVEAKVNFDAPNRGLSASTVANLRKHNLGDLLTRGRNQAEEADRQRRLKRFLSRYDEIARWRANQ